jgi:hypothetical protein
MAREIKKIAPATTVEQIADSVTRNSTRDEVTVPGKLTDWLNPRTKGKPVLDPVLLAAREDAPKKGKKKVKPVPATELPSAGGDGLPRPGRK